MLASFTAAFCFVHGEHNLIELKVLRNPCDNHNLTSIILKKRLLQLLLHFFVQIETENFKVIYESQFWYFIKWVKFALHLVHFMTNFELQLQEATKYFSYFWFQLVRIKSSKKPCPLFLITFLLFEILVSIIFMFPLKSVLKIENPSQHKNCTFFEESGTVLLSGCFLKCIALLKELHQRFSELEFEPQLAKLRCNDVIIRSAIT